MIPAIWKLEEWFAQNCYSVLWPAALTGLALWFLWRAAAAIRDLRWPARASRPSPVNLAEVVALDSALVEEVTESAKKLGFQFLLDYELDHFNTPLCRVIFSTFASPDGKVRLGLIQRIGAPGLGPELALVSDFTSGRRLVTTNGDVPRVVRRPGEQVQAVACEWRIDRLEALHRERLARLENEGEIPIEVLNVPSLETAIERHWDSWISFSVKRGYLVPSGEAYRASIPWVLRGMGWIAKPVRSGLSAAQHLLTLAGAALLLVGATFIPDLPRAPVGTILLWLAGAAAGGILGFRLSFSGLTWAILLPTVTMAWRHEPSLTRSVVFTLSLMGLLLGILAEARWRRRFWSLRRTPQ